LRRRSALIVRGPDGRDDYEKASRVEDVDLSEADPMSLKIGRFHERFKARSCAYVAA
jgi:hypothetical protein